MDFNELRKTERNNYLVVGTLSAVGILSLSASLWGRQIDLVEYCFKPAGYSSIEAAIEAGFCTPQKRYIMPLERFNASKTQPSNPKYQDGWVLPSEAHKLGVIYANNPYKWIWGLLGMACFGTALTLSKARERKLLEYLPHYRAEVKQSWLIGKIRAINDARKLEYTANLDYQLWEFSANRAAKRKQLSMLTPEEIAILQEQSRLQAEAETKAQMQAATGHGAPALPHGDPGTMEEQARQGKLEQSWLDSFIKQTALVWGNQGSGKSWFARYLAKRKAEEGYRVIVLDPDSNPAEWQGVESYHDFNDIASFLRWYLDDLTGRYQAFNQSNMPEQEWREKLWRDGKAIAIICEEVTTYIDLIEDKELLSQFFRLGLTKSRKQEMPLTFVSHNNTQSALGGVKGLGNLIARMLQIELKTDINPRTLQPTASGKGAVKLDGSNEWMPVDIPRIKKKITQFGGQKETDQEMDWKKAIANLEDSYKAAEFMVEDTSDRTVESDSELVELGDYLLSKLNGKGWVLLSQVKSAAWKAREWSNELLSRVVDSLQSRELIEVQELENTARIRAR
jgi:hypothetical protein